MNAYDITSLSTITAFLCVVLVARKFFKRNSFDTISYASFFVVSPILSIGGTLQKLVYFSDVFGLYFIFRKLKLMSLTEKKKKDVYDWIVMMVLIVIPLVGITFKLIFDEIDQWQFSAQMMVRSIAGYCLYSVARHDLSERRIEVFNIILSGLVGFTFISVVGAGQFVFGYSTDFLLEIDYVTDIVSGSGGYGGGVIGMWRGEYGGIAAAVICMVIAIFLKKPASAVLITLLVGLYFFVILSVGSRQGAAAAFIVGTLVTVLLSRFRQVDIKTIGAFLFVLLVAVLIAAGLIESTDIGDWIVARFEVFSGQMDVVGEASIRDLRMSGIIEKIQNNPINYIIGTGYGYGAEYVSSNLWELTYVDSDFLMTFQQHGFIGLVFYIFLIALVTIRLYRSVLANHSDSRDVRVRIGMLGVWLVGCSMIYGHYLVDPAKPRKPA